MSFRLDLTVISENENTTKLALTLNNFSNSALSDWTLHFIFGRYIQPDSLSHGYIRQIGSYCSITPEKNNEIAAGSSHYFEFLVNTPPFRLISDGIKDAVIQTQVSRIPLEITPLSLLSLNAAKTSIPDVKPAELALLPLPNNLVRLHGNLVIENQLVISSEQLSDTATSWFCEEIQQNNNIKIHFSDDNANLNLRINSALDNQAYTLRISEHVITIESNSHVGFIHAYASLLQLCSHQSTSIVLPCVEITDKPTYQYRGLMLDCARHFHPVEHVKRLINQLAHYKFNTFHWHLTDDEAWRIEINAFPELTNVGAWRGPNEKLEPQFSHISQKYGGYYSQDDIRSVVAYAQERGIVVIPEIDIPGHCRAAIKALPKLLCEQNDTSDYLSVQFYSDNVLNPALKGTYLFIDKVIEEICLLFPSPYIHIGADEVPDGVWGNSPACQRLLEEQGYSDFKALQGHLLSYAEKSIQSYDKRMVGWEEVQQGNKVTKDTVIYSWQNEEAAINCAKQGYDVVLQPAQTTYLDMAQDYQPEETGVYWANILTLEQAYRYKPLAHIKSDNPIRNRIKGIQCALWCEYVTHVDQIDYMLFPRIIATAEVAWTMNDKQVWTGFLSRLQAHIPRLEQNNIQYRTLC